ncbi:uncharacterized protein [Leptinotarsa decemlineata]|uniref:uncharacterized protein n=1 Tax=Leptinotarsa decemlineata TaxID=7539 RepID=UPI003D309CE6
MGTVADRKFKMLTAKKESLFSILQKLYDLSKSLGTAQEIEAFKISYLTLDTTREALNLVLDQINEVQFEIDDEFVPDYKLLSTINQLCCHIHMAEKGIQRPDQFRQSNSNSGNIIVDNRLPPLPKIELPEFSGEIRQWETFHSLFKSMIHDNASLTDLDKIHFLVGSLRGPASGICAGFSITGDNYNILYKALTEKYENKRMLADSYLQQIFDFKPLQSESARNLDVFLERFDVAVSALKKLNLPDLADFMLLYQALAKLDHNSVRVFEMKQESSKIPTYEDLIKFIQNQAKILRRDKTTSVSNNNNKPIKTIKTFVVNQRKKEGMTCVFCQKTGHYLGRCDKFKSLSPGQRYEAVRDNGWCYNCLSNKHTVKNCPNERLCVECSKKHHILLHLGKPNSVSGSNGEAASGSNIERRETVINDTSTVDVHLCSEPNAVYLKDDSNYTTLLASMVVFVETSLIAGATARFILDSGSEANLLTIGCCKRLGLKISKNYSSVYGLGGSIQKVKGSTIFTVVSRYNPQKKYTVRALVLDKITNKLPKFKVDISAFPTLQKVELADNNFDKPAEIDGILGVEMFANILEEGRITGVSGSPVAVKTTLGYVVMGQFPIVRRNQSVFFSVQEENSIDQLIRKFWDLEEIPKGFAMNPEDIECENIYTSTFSRDSSGRFTVALPFKFPPEGSLGNSRNNAQVRLLSLEKRLERDSKLRIEYNKVMQDFIDQGHMKLVDIDPNEASSYYIGHHPVIKPSSISTPVRIVLDASAPTDNNVSLNDILYRGGKLQADLVTLLLNFRLFKVALTADVRQLYRQINVIENHWRYQRLLWRFSPDRPIDTYEIKVVAFGIKSSPFLALRTIKQLIEDEGEKFPLAAKFVSRDIYMDDFCTSINSEKEAAQLYKESVDLFQAGCFDLTKWATNSKALLNDIPIEKRLAGNVFFSSDTQVLGIQWHTETDVFSFKVHKPDQKCTKRTMLSTVAKCYDPIGLLAPFILYLKILIKNLWTLKLEWDEMPPENILEIWEKIRSEWGELEKFKVPRHIGAIERNPVMVLAFADASLNAYGAVVYLRSVLSNNDVEVQLVCAKSKVSSAKRLTVPRLELLAALLLSNLVKYVLETYKERILITKTLAFSDSSTVLSWLKSSQSRDVFVANRIVRIQENIPEVSWYHIEGIQNPADCLSRGLLPEQLVRHPQWLHGPTWIKLPPNEWPCFREEAKNFGKKDIIVLNNNTDLDFHHPLLDLLERYSSWHKILRIIVWVLRFLKIIPNKKIISSKDLHIAELVLIKLVQIKHFDFEIQMLKSNRSGSSRLIKLHPFLQDGLLRVGGRLANSNLNFCQKHPLILPAKDILTEKLIDFHHKINLHTGAHLLEAILRQNYWILGGRNLIRSRIHKCNHCFRLKPKNVEPLMADLPAARVREARAFLHTGVDYFGPLKITLGRKRKASVHKAYVSLFICMGVKAIHLELVSSLSTDHFLQAFKRFIARRGPVRVIYSDCGTNFVGAKSILKELNEHINSQDFVNSFETELGINGVEWKFNTPFSPHQGGLWESNVKAVKNHIYRVIGNQLLTFEELSTVLTQIEALLNSRPLCRLSADPMAPEALTPAHFLTLVPLRGLPSEDVTAVPINRLNRFQLIDKMVQDFWKRWRTEYLTSLQMRSKWTKDIPNITVGSVVILKTDNAPPLHWPLAVVSDIHPGKDGRVRNVTLKTSKGTFKRPVVKICPLPTQ